MAKEPSSGRRILAGRASKVMRYAFRAAFVAGLGAVIYLGATLTTLTLSGLTESGNSLVATKPSPGGALVICGGGRLPDEIFERFLKLAGGKTARIVVIPTAHAYADTAASEKALEPLQGKGARSLTLFHTRSRKEADSPEFVRPIAEATGVWICGGKQQMLTDAYLGTEVERQLKALLERGGVIGGTSAGAAVMSRVMITSGRDEAKLGEGFDFMHGAVVDQHFLKRNRFKRLLGVVRQFPGLIGLGIDEQTALVVDIPNHRLSVVGKSYVFACLPEEADSNESPSKGPSVSTKATTSATSASSPSTTTPHKRNAPRFEVLKPGDEADFTALRTLSTNAVIPGIDLEGL